ncbi:hypothetical protein LY90DRAFT_503661 [Neocallimastix californiae]|uniref:Uncharacterized protein n=1 Tax=Neocallimastix californiae TaxID=1754190 RepID=A0A1Y2EMD1_9FUNG|nr:hypothetical protein LY90DRAFT_503661 [Neocallimastix californiae]|eukprot:ORY72702.1 hypothetical protein LY90DRAFT_503661 [Neocallimastix californiae]
MDEVQKIESLIQLITALKLNQREISLKDFYKGRQVYEEDPNDYGDELIPILKEARIVYVFQSSYHSSSTNVSNTNPLNINKLKQKYNLRPMIYREVYMTHMFFNRSDLERGYSVYPYSFKKLVNFYKKKNVEANVFLIKTKYHSWDEDLDGRELYEAYEGKVTNKPYNSSHNYYYSKSFNINPIWRETDLGKLEENISIPFNYLERCRVYFIAIRAKNGLTCVTNVFSILYQPFAKKDEKLGILSGPRIFGYGFRYYHPSEDSTNNDTIDEHENENEDSTNNDTINKNEDENGDSTNNDTINKNEDENEDSRISNDTNAIKDLTTRDNLEKEKDPTSGHNTSNKMKNKKKKNNKKKNNKKKNKKKKRN